MQRGAYGDCFFVNVGLPMPYTGRLEIWERPREHECILRRLERLAPMAAFQSTLVSWEDAEAVREVIAVLPTAEAWLHHWGTFEACSGAEWSDVSRLLSCAPLVQEKAYWMLRTFCKVQLEDTAGAGRRSRRS